MRYPLFAGMLLLLQAVSAQTLQPGQDTTLCPGQSVTFSPLLPDTSDIIFFDSATTVTLSDDEYSGLIDIGFDFTFYDGTYSQLVIGTNGIISFNANYANGYCQWGMNGMPYPNFTHPHNSIAPVFIDMDSTTRIRYKTMGTAPDRTFVVLYQPDLTSAMTCGEDACWTTAIVLHETTNDIDMFVQNKPACGGVQGIQNSSALIAHMVNQDPYWTTANDGKRWTRNSNTSYTISAIPFQFVLDNSYTLNWVTPNGVYPYDDQFTPTGITGDSNAVYLAYSSPDFCNNIPVPINAEEISYVGIYPSILITGVQLHHESCFDENDGSYLFYITNSTPGPHIIYWDNALASSQSFTNLAPGSYPLTIVDGNSCERHSTVTINGVADPLDQSAAVVDATNGTNGSAVITASGGTAPYTYSIGGAFQSSDLFTQLTPGTYSCVVKDAHNCTDTLSFFIDGSPLSLTETAAKRASFYPNPVDQTVYVKTVESGCTITLSDISGKVCLTLTSAQDTPIDMSRLKSGVYLIKVEKDQVVLLSEKVTKL